jgi:hypothetical protein
VREEEFEDPPLHGDEEDFDAEEIEDEHEVSAVGPGHVELRTIVLPGRKIVYVPNLKAGCTSVLWMLARLAGLGSRRFERSPLGAVSRAMTIHTMAAWPPRYRWYELSDAERDRIAGDDAWLRFTLLRDPSTRLWSAWQSKLLLREPGFTRRFGDESWFPRIPEKPQDVIDDFRSFVLALGSSNPPYDAHWARQTDVLASAPQLNHIGKLESMPDTMRVLREHVGPAWDSVTGADENKSLLRYDRALFDDDMVEIVNTYYAADFAELDYEPLSSAAGTPRDAWITAATGLMNGVSSLCRCHERIEDLHKQAKRAARYHAELEGLKAENARLESWIDAAGRSVPT